MLKILDKFLNALKTDRNTFFTYVLSLLTVYFLVDRLIEFAFIVFTGVAYYYWSPIMYTVALACCVFTFAFAMKSKFVKVDQDKVKWFNRFVIEFYILVILMFTEGINKLLWMGFISVPNFTGIVQNFGFLISPAFGSLAIMLPLLTGGTIFKKLFLDINDTRKVFEGIYDYKGIDLSSTPRDAGNFSNELFLGIEKEYGTKVKLAEIRRYESTLVVGVSGAGKTTLVFEPWIAQDLYKKYFYRETAKSMANAALRTGIATLNAPYDNDYINNNFSLNMILPVESKAKAYSAYFKKLIMNQSGSDYTYRDLGLTYIAPDDETIEKMKKVCAAHGIGYYLFDPNSSDSIGLNPFSFTSPLQSATAISTILGGFYASAAGGLNYKENLANQIIENLAILLKVVYPKLNAGKLPNLNDMYKLLNNFDVVEKMCRILEEDEVLSKEYENQIQYFKKNFYEKSNGKEEMKKLVSIPLAQLDTLLRYPGIKRILCNRENNINFDKAIENGDVCLVCTRRGDLGETAHKAFGLFFLLLMQYSILRRPGNEKSRIPHFLYVDEFADFVCPATELIFTTYRKYRIGTVISVQNLSQLRGKSQLVSTGTDVTTTGDYDKIGDTILANCSNKLVFGGGSPEDAVYWEKEIGQVKKWWITDNDYDKAKDAYAPKANVAYRWGPKQFAGTITGAKFKRVTYKLKDSGGKIDNGQADLDFMPAKYLDKQKIKTYNFTSYSNGIANNKETDKYNDTMYNKFGNTAHRRTEKAVFSGDNSDGPIHTDPTNLSIKPDANDAIYTPGQRRNNNKKASSSNNNESEE